MSGFAGTEALAALALALSVAPGDAGRCYSGTMNGSDGARPAEGSFSPQEAAEALGVSPSGLRRLAEIYSRVCGELPREPRTRSRIWPERAVSELGAARNLVLRNRSASIREALEALRRGETVPERRPGGQRPSSELLERMATGLHVLHGELEVVRGELTELRRAVAGLSAELAERPPAPHRRSQVGDRATDAACDRELHELRRRLRYLQAELEVREL